MIFLQADPVAEENALDTLVQTAPQAITETAKDLINGDISTLHDNLHFAWQQIAGYGIEAGRSILIALLYYFVGRYIIKFIKKVLIEMMERRQIDPTIQSFLRSTVSILLNVLLIITVISALGINTTSFAALLASFGVAAGLALSGNLQNLAGGIVVLLFKPYRVGDYIEAQGVAGTVKGIEIFHTIILTVDNKQIHVPNGSLSSGSIINYSSMPLRRVDLTIGVEYGEDIEKVKTVIQDIISQDDHILKDEANAPFVRVCELADSSVNFTVRLWTAGANYWDVFFDTQEKIYAEFNRQGIGFPYPHLTVTTKA